MKRDKNFGKLLAIANVLGQRVFDNKHRLITAIYGDKIKKNPAKAFQLIHENLMQYQYKFGDEEWYLMDLIEEIMSEFDYEDFNNEEIEDKANFQLHFHKQQSALNNIVGVDEAAEILGLSPGTVKNYCASGKIEAKKIGKTWVIDKNRLNKGMDKMTRLEAIAKVNELLKEDATAQFDEQEERTAVNGNMHFLVSNSKGLAVQVELDYDEETDSANYRINEEWA